MNREIKFRIWHLDGYFVDFKTMDVFIEADTGEIWINEGGEDWVSLTGTIMQYTGLKDKNGVEIYDSDFVEFNNREVHKVEFPDDYLWVETQHKEIEVIGNLYENPELLGLLEKEIE